MIDITRLTERFYDVLKQVTKNVFPLVATEGCNLPFIVFERSNMSETNTKDGASGLDVSFTVRIVSATYFEGLQIADELRYALHRMDEQPYLTSASEEYTTDGYLQTLNFSF